MKKISFTWQITSLFDKKKITPIFKQLLPQVQEAKNSVSKKELHLPYAFLTVPFDQELRSTVEQLVKKKKELKPSVLVVIGIGGSNLGTIAVHEAINGTFYNELNPPIKVYFADTVDSDYIAQIISIVEEELKDGKNVLLNVISKSGSTTETIANFEIFLQLLQKYKKNWQKSVVITSDKESLLWNFSQVQQIDYLEIPKQVGGRYSVLSAVGLFPLGMLGINLKDLQQGAQQMVDQCTSEDLENNIAAISASIAYQQYKDGKNIADIFLFSVFLESVGKWWRQLVAESLGKTAKVGITPIVSIGSNDLHSMAQLYLGGPFDKFTTFVSVEKNKTNIQVPQITGFETISPALQNKSLPFIMSAIAQGVQKAYLKNKRPYVSVILPEINAYCIGQLLQFKMIETIYLGYLLGINPFDQPAVELYKKETREILK